MAGVTIQPQAMETLTITMPRVDLKRFKSLAKAMGWVFEPKSERSVREVARTICTEEEYQRLDAEGFIDNPQPHFGPFTDEEIIQEIIEGEKDGYVGIERSQLFMDSLLRV